MDVARREKFPLTRGDPAFSGCRLTLRAVAIAAAVVGKGGTMPVAGALIDMPAECRGTTPRNGQQHFDMLPADPLAISFDEGSSRAADEIGTSKGGRLIYPSCGDASFSCSESSGLGVVLR